MSKGFDISGSNDFGASTPPFPDQSGSFEPEVKPGRGCCFYGCIVAIILLILSAAGCYLVYRYVTGKFREYVQTYTEGAPRPLPVVDIPQEKRDEIVKRIEDFQKRLTIAPGPGDPRTLTDEQRTLVLTADELNAYIEKDPDVRGKFYVAIEGGELKAQVSLPLNELPGLRGRYLNGDAKVAVSVDDGAPVVQLRDVRVKGLALPESLRQMVEGINLAAEEMGPEGKSKPRDLARKLESIDVKDGKLTIVARKEPEGPEPGPSEPASDSSAVVTWSSDDGGNGHSYELVKVKKSWTEADADARMRTHDGLKGHLVTITSEGENAFLRDRIAVNEQAWIGLTDDPKHGGKESRDLPDPRREGWAWVTGEPVQFVAWSDGEPDHGGEKPENFVEFNGQFGPKRGQWSDQPDDAPGGRFYVVEYESATPTAR